MSKLRRYRPALQNDFDKLVQETLLDYAEQCDRLLAQVEEMNALIGGGGMRWPDDEARITEVRSRLALLANGMRNLARDLA